uniref:ALOG domain-containing protein n=1 Tax=Cajanus cajan TaxID=3821 RepID=A0A151S6F5_CAJCA|nr:hypothetical protein KK1_027863 [Cajanus cajan]
MSYEGGWRELKRVRYVGTCEVVEKHLPEPPAPCTCPLRQAWGSLDALIGRLRAAYEEHGGSPETNPFGSGAIRVYLREVKECQAKARGIPYTKKKKKKKNQLKGPHHDAPKSFKQLAT